MKTKLILFRILALIALAACCASLLDYLLPSPAFCGFKAGCDEVTHSAYGSLLGIPLSAWGLAAFGIFYAATLFPTGWIVKLLGPAAIVAGLCGLGLILLQVLVIKQLCPTCLIVDAAALVLAAVELGLTARTAELPRPRRWLWGTLAAVALAGPLLWPLVRPIPPVPPQVQAYWQPGKITVVEVTDFQCPYCRQTHPALAEFLKQHGDQLHFVRLVQPLEHHAQAQHAARAYRCAQQLDRAEAMADALFAAEDLSPESCERLAESVGLDLSKYRACIAAADTDQQDAATAWVEAADIHGLPVIWVHNQRLFGLQTPASLEAAFRRVQREHPHGFQPAASAD